MQQTSVAILLANIRAVFNTSVSDLVDAFGISRKTIYGLMFGEEVDTQEINEEKLARIIALNHAATAFKEAGVMHPSNFLKLRAFDGCSMLELAGSGQLSQEKHVQPLIKEALARDEAYRRSGLAERKNAPATDDWLSDVSVPGGIE